MMELYRKRNTATKIVFPLMDAASTSAYYTTSAWNSLTNSSKKVYCWSDDDSAPTSATIDGNPIQLDSTGEWYMVISASEISASSQYMSIKLKADQILEQTILIRITNYDSSNVSAACVEAIQDQFTFSGSSVISYAIGGSVSADTTSIVNAILAATIDTKSFSEIMEILLAMAQGRITRSNNLFTYYKQDNTTSLFTLESERSERTRL